MTFFCTQLATTEWRISFDAYWTSGGNPMTGPIYYSANCNFQANVAATGDCGKYSYTKDGPYSTVADAASHRSGFNSCCGKAGTYWMVLGTGQPDSLLGVGSTPTKYGYIWAK